MPRPPPVAASRPSKSPRSAPPRDGLRPSGRGMPRPYEESTNSINCEPGAALFTGIVEEAGTIREVREEGNGVVFTIACGAVREGLGLGDSVAIDGACLTVTSLPDGAFTV